MWLVAAVAAFGLAVLLHALLCRSALRGSPLLKLLIVGMPVGAALGAYVWIGWGLTAKGLAAVALYAAACELYIFLFGSVYTSISWKLLLLLVERELGQDEIDRHFGGAVMVSRRLADMVAGGMVRPVGGGYEVTAKGQRLARLLRWLRRLFVRPPLLPALSAPAETPLTPPMPFRRIDLLALLALAGLVAVLFMPYLTGDAVFVGDSDRMNHYLTVLNYQTEGLRQGVLRTWNDRLFGGYSVVTLPYTYPNPFAALALLWPPEKLFTAAAFISALLLALSGWSAYAFVRDVVSHRLAAAVGAALYQTAALPILKIGQNDMSFAVLVLIPLILLAVRRVRAGREAHGFVALALLLTTLLTFTFLQKAAYAVILTGCYALWRVQSERSLRPALVFGAALATAVVLAFPRLYGVGEELSLNMRNLTGGAPPDFATVYPSVRLDLTELLRVLDERIFGDDMGQALAAGNLINLHEGVLFYASTFSAALLAFGLVRHFPVWVGWRRLADSDVPFFLAVLVAVFLVALTPWGYRVFYELFLKTDFIHARVFVLAVIAYAVLAAAFLRDLIGSGEAGLSGRQQAAGVAGALAAAALLIGGIELVADLFDGRTLPLPWSGFRSTLVMFENALVRVGLSLALSVAILAAIAVYRRRPAVRGWLGCLFGFLMIGQAAVFAGGELSGHHLRSPSEPYLTPARLSADIGEYQPPSAAALAAFRDRLQPDEFRTAIVCYDRLYAIHCGPHLVNFWHLRAIEGYISSIPRRIVALPWLLVNWRSINFTTFEQLPWPLLGLFNVRYALHLDPALMVNRKRLPDGNFREAAPGDAVIRENPFPVTPRQFFAHRVDAVVDLEAAREALFPRGVIASAGYDVRSRSVVEGLPGGSRDFVTGGDIRIHYDAQRITVDLEPTSEPRFLVLNELYHPRWRAFAGKRELPIYPTNVAMRGVVVPPGVERLTFRYIPFAASRGALPFYGGGLLLLLLGSARFSRRK